VQPVSSFVHGRQAGSEGDREGVIDGGDEGWFEGCVELGAIVGGVVQVTVFEDVEAKTKAQVLSDCMISTRTPPFHGFPPEVPSPRS